MVEFEELNVRGYLKRPLVTVWCVTYNHKKYIKDALEGFIRQKTTFPFEVMIFDDASTDGTTDTIRWYAKRYPELIKAYIANRNIFRNANRGKILKDIMERDSHGMYIALCEGDDCWIDDYKLQKQFDFMEAHKECVLHTHASIWSNTRSGEVEEFHPYSKSGYLSAEELILKPGGNVSTASMFVRREVYFIEDKFPTADVGDVVLQLYALTRGGIYYSDQIMCKYNYMHEGSWSLNHESNYKERIEHSFCMCDFLCGFDAYTSGRYKRLVNRLLRRYFYDIVQTKCENIIELERIFSQIVSHYKFVGKIPLKRILEIYRLIHDESANINAYFNKIGGYKRIIIYGTGRYSVYLEKLLNNSGIQYTGYIVSDGQSIEVSKNKPIWHLGQYPYSFDNTIILIGVLQELEEDIMKAMMRYGVSHYIAPFWFDRIVSKE